MKTAVDLHRAASVLACCILILMAGAFAQGIECKHGCHSVNGFCETTGECRCKSGWQGELCDQCIPFPGCLHGDCTKPWECACEEGWTGSLCDTASNSCSPVQPCANNSTCIESEDGGFICICGQGFIGTHCQFRKGSCHNKRPRCQNGGSCFDDNKAYCFCLPGFTGDFCEINIDNCHPNPCANNGTCTDQFSGFSCTCPNGFTGKFCDYSVISCLSHPCQNGGTCHDHLGGGFYCDCLPEYEGETCQTQTFNHDTKHNVSKHTVTRWIRHGKPLQRPLHISHKSTHQQGNGMLTITVKETIHKSNSLLSSSQMMCFTVLGLLTCLVILGTTGIIFFYKCEIWLANVKYRHLLWKQRKRLQDKDEDFSVKIIFPSVNQLTNYGKNYTSI